MRHRVLPLLAPVFLSKLWRRRRTKAIQMLHGSASENSAGAGGGGSSGGSARVSSRSRASEEPHIGKYKLLKTIGKGNFAKVKLAKHVPTGKEVAIKIIDKTQLNPSSLQKLFREKETTAFHDLSLPTMALTTAGSERFYPTVATSALRADNENARPPKHREAIPSDRDREDFIPCYGIRVRWRGKKYDGPEVDVWSLGVILYTLVSGSLPFDGSTLRELRERVLRGKYRIPFYMSTDCENLLKKFLVLNPAKRASLESIMRDKWMNTGYEDDELRPYVEPQQDFKDHKRIEALVCLGYNRQEIEYSLAEAKYDDVFATYLLLGRKSTDPESDGSRSGSSLSLRNAAAPGQPQSTQQGNSHAVGTTSSAANNTTSTATTTTSNFKRQNTIDSASIKENTARIALMQVQNTTRPTSAQPKLEPRPRILSSGARRSEHQASHQTAHQTSHQTHQAPKMSPPHDTPSLNSTLSTGGTVGSGATGNSASARRDFSNNNPLVFPRNVPSRSTFHSGQTRSRGGSAGGAYGDGGSPHQARPSFFSKLSSRFSKRLNQNP
ncbi:jg1401 [Pararge aegeria aegeria]|uniref:non-specific serine/threonine protein kinase n=1 Tax=Pararge aegeria aegeria TaxID=348720 RepID=A0A8S4RFW0_9NEOP|nr:jg1401 [Pararge aegeria aegeria]